MGINNFRLFLHNTDMVKIADIYRKYFDGLIDCDEIDDILKSSLNAAVFSNGFFNDNPGFKKVAI